MATNTKRGSRARKGVAQAWRLRSQAVQSRRVAKDLDELHRMALNQTHRINWLEAAVAFMLRDGTVSSEQPGRLN